LYLEARTSSKSGYPRFRKSRRNNSRSEPASVSKAAAASVSAKPDVQSGLDAARAAFEVGSESPTQFNREYSRFFGQPPSRDVRALRDSGTRASEPMTQIA